MFRSTSFASHIVKDPLEAKQKKTLEEYKRVLTKVDMNLKENRYHKEDSGKKKKNSEIVY